MAASLTEEVLPVLLEATTERLPALLGWIGVAALAVGLACLLARGRGRWRTGVFWGLALAAGGLAIWNGWQRLWLCDDAFISFRYARNLVDGHGLVFNPGEWVEGYTNFLWTAALAGFGALGLDIPLTALFGDLVSCVAVVLLAAAIVRRSSPGTPLIPFAALALAGSVGFTTFASSGLETMPAVALVMAGVLWVRRPAVSGLFFVLAAMTRPDHLLFWGCMGLALATEDVITRPGALWRRLRWRRYLAFTAPLVLIFVPYWLLRWKAYGDPWPNTYYAKSGGSSYYEQGRIYLSVWLAGSSAWVWLTAFVVAAIGRPRSGPELRLRVFAGLATLIYGHYVVRVGGDFMLERFFVVLWPVVLVPLEISIRHIVAGARRARWLMLPIGAAALGAAVTHVETIPDHKVKWFLAAEHTFYAVDQLDPLVIDSYYFRTGQTLGEHFGHLEDPPSLTCGSVGLLGYYSRMPIVDRYGLTNRAIARKSILARGRPGHEKRATFMESYTQGAEIGLRNFWGKRWSTYTAARVGGVRVYLLRDLRRLRPTLQGTKGLRLPPLPDRALNKAAGALRRSEVVSAWRFYKRFVTGPKALAEIEARLGAVADFEFAMPEGLEIEGTPPARREGRPPPGATGEGWLELDGPATRTLRLPLDLTGAQELRLRLGGDDLPGHRVELRVDGAVIRQARPPGGRELRPVAWRLPAGITRAELHIVDAVAAPQTQMMVDDVHLPGGPNDIRVQLRAPAKGAYQMVERLSAAAEVLPEDDPDIAAAAAALTSHRWSFSEPGWPADLSVQGKAFGSGPARWPVGKQQPVIGAVGGLLNSYHGGDAATGRVEFPEIVLPEGGIGLLVGGGRDCKRTFVGLEVGGEVVHRACGQRDEQLRVRILPTRAHAGKRGRVVVVDQDTRPWGHILVDEVVIMKDPPPPAEAPEAP